MNTIFHWARRSGLALSLLAPVSLSALAAQTPAPSAPVQAPIGQGPVTVISGPKGTTTTAPVQIPSPLPPIAQPHQEPIVPIAPPDPKVRLDCASVDHDFGSMIEGEIARHTFEMKSSGENPLIIVSAKPTCGCTVSQVKVEGAEAGTFVNYVYGQPIASGKRVQIEAELNTKNKHNQTQSKINVQCNDPRTVVILGLTAMVDTYFLSSPAQLDFGEMSTSDSRELTAFVSSKRGGKFKLWQDMVAAIPGIRIEIKAVNPDAEGRSERWEVKVTLGPDCREGGMGYPVQLRSDQLVANAPVGHDGQAAAYGASVMVSAKVRGLISFEPQYLSFGLVRPGQQLTRTLKISCYDEKFQLALPKSVSFKGQSDAVPEFRWAENFEAVSRLSEDGKSVDIDVMLKGMPAGADSAFQGRVMIETGHPARPTIAVLFSGVCRSGTPAPAPVPVPVPVPVPKPVAPAKGQ